jgi:hypothetical protein
MTFDSTAWQKAETLAAGVASSVREAYWRSGGGAADDFDFFGPLADLADGLEDDGGVLPEDVWVVLRPWTCPST